MTDTIEIYFKYNRKKAVPIISQTTETLKDVCEKYAKSQSLEMDDIFFIYKEEKINLNSELLVGQQFNPDKLSQKKFEKTKIEIKVYDDILFHIQFIYYGTNIFIEAKRSQKIDKILRRFAKLVNKDINSLLFLYGGKKFGNDEKNEKFEKFIKPDDTKNQACMVILVDDNNNDNDLNDENKDNGKIDDEEEEGEEGEDEDEEGEENTEEVNNDLDNFNHENEILNPLIGNNKNINQQYAQKKWLLVYSFFILLIQYSIIIILAVLGFHFRLNEIFINSELNIMVKYFLLMIIIFFASIGFNEYLYKLKKNAIIFTYLISYIIIVVYYSFFLSQCFDYKYIIIGLSFIFLEISSQAIYALCFFKKDTNNLLFFGISSSTLSFIWLVLFSALRIKSLIPIIWMVIFYLFTIGYNFLWVFIIFKFCQNDEYYYSAMLSNYGIFLGITYAFSLGLKSLYKLVKNKFEESNSSSLKIKIFTALLCQYIIIIILVWFGFSFEWNYEFKNNKKFFHYFFWPTFSTSTLFCISFFYMKNNPKNGIICYIYGILYIPMMIIYYFSFSSFIEDKYILCFTFMIFFDLLAIIILNLRFSKYKERYIFISCLISNILIIPFQFAWLKNIIAFIILTLLSLIVDVYLFILSYVIEKYNYINFVYFSVVAFDYSIFSLSFILLYFSYIKWLW